MQGYISTSIAETRCYFSWDWIYDHFSGGSVRVKVGKRFNSLRKWKRAFGVNHWFHLPTFQVRFQFLQDRPFRSEHKYSCWWNYRAYYCHNMPALFHCLDCPISLPCFCARQKLVFDMLQVIITC